MGRLTAIVLGSAAGGAFPQWNCRCPVCALAWAGDSRVRPRTQTGIAVSAGDGRWTLINASPDLPSQIRATPALHPQGALRGSPIDAVVLTGAEIDQITGLLSLRESSPFTLYATPASHAAVAANAMFGAMAADVAPRDQSGRTLPACGRYRGDAVHGSRQTSALSRRRGAGTRYRKRSQCRDRIAPRGSTHGICARDRGSNAGDARTLRAR